MSEAKKSAFQDEIVGWLEERNMLVLTAFALVVIIDVLLLYAMIYYPENSCLAVIGIGVLTPFVFIWFKMKNIKNLFILTTVVFLILSPILAGIVTEKLYSGNPILYSRDNIMNDGKVIPYIGNGENRTFNFRVVVSSNSNATVYLNLTDMYGGEHYYPMNTTDNITYYRELNLDKGVYAFYFSIKTSNTNNTSTEWKYTFWNYGPLNMEEGDYFIQSLLPAFLATFIYFGLLSYILLGMYWWTQIAKQKKKEMVTVKKPEEGDSVRCPVCGNKIPKGAEKCPYCGAELIYDKEQEEEKSDEGQQEEEEEGKVEGNEPEDSKG